MAKLHAFWIHGTSAVCENLGSITQVTYQGFGATFSKVAGGEDWIHLPIPTQVITQDVRSVIGKAFVLFDAKNGAKVVNFHVFDGISRIASRDGTSMTGNHLGIDDGSIPEFNRNWFRFGGGDSSRRPEIFGGIGVTIKVLFPVPGSSIFIPSAGADLFA